MSNLTKEQTQMLIPTNPVIKEATLTAFKKFNGMDMAAAEDFLNKAAGASVPPPIPAKVTLVMGLIVGRIIIEPTEEYKNCKFDAEFWGLGVAGIESVGIIYTAYTSWDAFFKNVTSFHVQGIAEGPGLLQVNFFRADGTPIGQFDGLAGGVGIFQAGGPGKWACK